MTSKKTSVQPSPLKERFLFFGAGAGAGLIIFLLVGIPWQTSHPLWVLLGTTLLCGLLAVFARQDFAKTTSALLDGLPWI